MKKVRLGLIGMGMIGKLHAETMSKMKDIEFVAASDADAKHQKTAEELGTKYYQSYEEMIGKENWMAWWLPFRTSSISGGRNLREKRVEYPDGKTHCGRS